MNHFPPVKAWLGRSRALVFAAMASTVALGGASAQAAIYTETFPNSGAAKNFSSIGWNAHIGPTATNFTNTTDVSSAGPAVVWTTPGQGGDLSYGFSSNAGTGSLFWTSEFGSIAQNEVEAISFWTNNSTTTSTLQIAIRLDNNTPTNFADDLWFATSQTFFRNGTVAGSSGNWATNGELEFFSFTTAASAWKEISFTAGVSLSLAAAPLTQALPSGDINAVGLYGVGSGLRFDTLQVVPEPSTLVLSVGALVGLLGIRRHRR